MPQTLSLILNEISLMPDREEALGTVLGWVMDTLEADGCILYRRRPETGDLDRLVRRWSAAEMPVGVELANRVAEERGPLRIGNPWRHRGHRSIPEAHSSPVSTYLGVPLIRNRQVLGVLEVWRLEDRPFSDEDAALLLTLSIRMAGSVAEFLPERERPRGEQKLYFGTPAAPGVAIGTVVSPPSQVMLETVPDKAAEDMEAEIDDFEEAVRAVQSELRAGSVEMTARLPEEVHALYGVYEMILDDPGFVTEVIAGIRSGKWAPAALRDTVLHLAGRFEAMEDLYLRARAEDVRAVGRRILLHLRYGGKEPGELPERTILVGKGVGLTCITAVPPERLVGLACSGGSALSHGVIVARALGIPAVAGLEGLRADECGGREIIVDGYRGRVILDPAPDVRAEFQRLQDEEAALAGSFQALRDTPAQTPDGRRIPLEANIALLNEIRSAKERGAEGVGLYRTEFPFLFRESLPGEGTQYAIYHELLEAFAPRPVTMRTLDAGGDKALPYLPFWEPNPALGLRGIRLCLAHPEIFHTQLRALLRANTGLDNLRLLLPMVTLPAELEEARALIARAHESLLEEGLPAALPPVGIMLEVPAAVFRIDELAAAADFISIGTNDLTQYILAADRTNSDVGTMCDPLTPAVLTAVEVSVVGARKQGVPVSVCGEMAGDPLGALLLLGAGVDRLSMATGSIPRVKRIIRSFSTDEALALWKSALCCNSAQQVRGVLTEALEDKGLGGLIRPGR